MVKTFIQRTSMAKIGGSGRNVLATAYSRIAVSLIKGGRTFRSKFKLPMNIFESKLSPIIPYSHHPAKIRSRKMLFVNEANMIQVNILTIVNLLF